MILAVGASVRTVMESAAGCRRRVMGIDFFGDVDAGWHGPTLSLTEDCGLKPTVRNLLAAASDFPCRGLVFTAGPENAPEELAYWEERGLLKGNGGAVLSRCRNPWELNRLLRQVGARMPRFIAAVDWRQVTSSGIWLLKPLNRGGGHGIRIFPGREEEAQSMISGLAQPAQFILQEYQKGIPGSATFLANASEAVLLGTSRQFIRSRGGLLQLLPQEERTPLEEIQTPFLYAGNIVPLNLKRTMKEDNFQLKMTLIVRHLTKSLGLKGINTLDFIVTEEGVRVLELNPRWSASVELIERRLGRRLFAAHLAACNGASLTLLLAGLKLGRLAVSEPQWVSHPQRFWGKKIVCASLPVLVRPYEKKALQALYRQGVRDIPHQGTQIEAGQPICTVLASGLTEQDCEQQLAIKAGWAGQYYGQAARSAAR